MKHDEFWQATRTLLEFQQASPPLSARPEGVRAVLSRSQARLRLLHDLREDPTGYNLSVRLRIFGSLDPERLARALERLVDRQQILKSVFPATAGGGGGLQELRGNSDGVILDRIDLSDAADPDTALKEFLNGSNARRFDLERVGPLRAALVRLGPELHVLCLTIHHIAFDFDSLRVLGRELGAFYAAGEDDPSLPPLKVQYADFAEWQARALATPAYHDRLLTFWREELAGGVGGPPAFEARREPASADGAGRAASIPLRLSPELTATLRALTEDEGGTLFTTLLAAFFVLLHDPDHPAGENFYLACPASGRTRGELAHLIGYFVNPLVLRGDLAGRPSFRELLARMRGTVARAFAHQDLPVDEIDATGLLKTPLGRVMFALLPPPRWKAEGEPRMELEDPGAVYGSAADFGVYLYLIESGDHISGRLIYDSDVLTEAGAQRLIERYTELLGELGADLDRPVADLPRLAGDERGVRAASASAMALEDRLNPQDRNTSDGMHSTVVVPDGDPTREYIRRILVELLGPKMAGLAPDVSLYRARFDSLAAIRLRNRILSDQGVDLRLARLLRGPSIAELAGLVKTAQPVSATATATATATAAAGDSSPANRERVPGSAHDSDLPGVGQAALWFVARQPDSARAYNVAHVARVPAALTEKVLRRALTAVARGVESLRMSFTTTPRGPRLVVREDAQFEFHKLDGRRWSRPRLLREYRSLLRRPYDLERGPLSRVALVERAEGYSFLMIGADHIAIDYPGMNLLVAALADACAKLLRDPGAEVAAAPSPYRRFIQEEAAYLRTPAAGRSLRAWSEVLENPPPAPRLPFARGDAAGFAGDALKLRIGPDLRAAIFAASREFAVSPFNVLLAAFYALLYRYSGQEDIIIGSPTAGRHLPEREAMIGYLINPIPLRLHGFAGDDFAKLVERVSDVTRFGMEHRDYPFPLLVKRFAPERAGERTPYFSHLFNYLVDRNGKFERADMGRVDGENFFQTVDLPLAEGQFDLTLEFVEREDELSGWLKFNLGCLDRGRARRVREHYLTLLRALLAEPRRSIETLPLASSAEEERLLRFAGGAREVLAGIRSELDAGAFPSPALLHQWFDRQALRTPGATAIIHGHQSVTYADLSARAEVVAEALRDRGVGPERPVALLLRRDSAMVAAVLGVLRAGGAYVPLDLDYPPDRVRFMLTDCQASVLITNRAAPDQSHDFPASSIETLYIEEIESSPVAAGSKARLPARESDPDGLAYVIYTSGSTGRPKGVAITHRSAAAFLDWTRTAFSSSDLERVLAATSLCFDLSIFELFATLSRGGAVVLADNLLAWSNLPAPESVTLVNTVPSAMRELLRHGLPGRPRVVNLAGEPLDRELANELIRTGARVHDLYGPSEDTTYSTWTGREMNDAPGIGRPIAGTRAYVLDEALNRVPRGLPGELYLGGAGLARGYLGRAALTAERFLPDPFANIPGARMYRTGDLVAWSDDGRLTFLGRVDQQIKVRGYRIEPGEIEAALRAYPGVREGAVHFPDAETGLVGYYVPDPDDRSRAASAGVAEWRGVWDETYNRPRDRARNKGTYDPRFDIAGWVDSNGRPFSPQEMREWVAATARQIKAMRAVAAGVPDAEGPRAPSLGRVLELGCGTGLMLFALLDGADHYTALDFSRAALDGIKDCLAPAESAKVELMHGAADRVTELSGAYDLILLNSVVQYFPDKEYLRRVIAGAARLLNAGGMIFIGDVRSLALARARGGLEREGELLLAPSYFDELGAERPEIEQTFVLLKEGRFRNELNRYRYQVALLRDARPLEPVADWREGIALDPAELDAAFVNAPDAFGFHNVPNGRLESVSRGVDPELLREAAKAAGYEASMSWARHDERGEFDVVFRKSGRTTGALPAFPGPRTGSPSATLYNDPGLALRLRVLEQELRDHLKAALPEYMIPARLHALERLPRTASGKIDRKALPAPERARPILTTGFTPPRTVLETRVAELWRELLRLERVGLDDNFFDLGGHSLLLVRVGSTLRERFAYEISLTDLFRYPTVRGLAGFLTGDATGPGVANHEPSSARSPASASTESTESIDATDALGHARVRRLNARRRRAR